MGNCLPKPRKRNRVEPTMEEKGTQPDGTPDKKDNAERAEVTKKAIAFTVLLDDNQQAKAMMPKRLADRMYAGKEPNSEVEYTREKESLMAAILREDRLNKIKEINEKARLRKLRLSASSTPTVTEKRQKVKDMADTGRKTAAGRSNGRDDK